MGRTRQGSFLDRISRQLVGEVVVYPAGSHAEAMTWMRSCSTTSRFPGNLAGARFTTQLVTVVAGVGEASATLMVIRTH